MSKSNKKPESDPKIKEIEKLLFEIEEPEEIEEKPIKKPKNENLFRKKFENKIDFSPIIGKLEIIEEKLKDKQQEKIAEPQKRPYRLFDEFDPSIKD